MGNLSGVASCKNNIGALHKEAGRLERAIDEFKKCLDLAKKMDNFELISKATINMGLVHVDIGDLEKAEHYAWKALEHTTKSRMKIDEGKSWELLGDVNYRRGNYSWALDCYQRASGCMEGLSNEHNGERSFIHLKILESLCLSDETSGWRRNLTAGLSAIKGKKKKLLFQARIRKAVIFLEKGRDAREAVALLSKALGTIGRDSPWIMDLWQVSSLLVRAHHAAGSLNGATESAQVAGSALSRIRQYNKNKRVIKSFLSRKDVKEFLSFKNSLKIEK
jgi:tetratricopeptide (TPR) repeat protein